MKKFLIINPFGLGDVLFSLPLMHNIKSCIPDAEVSYMANKRCAEMLQDCPDVHEVFVYNRDDFLKTYKQSKIAFVRRWRDLILELKSRKYDVLFDLSLNTGLNMLASMTDVSYRIGFNYRKRSPFLTHAIPLKAFENQHVAVYNLQLLKFIGLPQTKVDMSLRLHDRYSAWAEQWYIDQSVDLSKSLVAVIPGGGASWGKEAKNRRWSVQKYAELADRVAQKTNAQIILFGDSQELDLCLELRAAMKSKSILAAGQTTIPEFAALISCCNLVICNEGGPLHVAVAVGVKTASIFGPVDDIVYSPYPVEDHVIIQKELPCQPCYKRFRMTNCNHNSCIRDLTVDEVFRKVEPVL